MRARGRCVCLLLRLSARIVPPSLMGDLALARLRTHGATDRLGAWLWDAADYQDRVVRRA